MATTDTSYAAAQAEYLAADAAFSAAATAVEPLFDAGDGLNYLHDILPLPERLETLYALLRDPRGLRGSHGPEGRLKSGARTLRAQVKRIEREAARLLEAGTTTDPQQVRAALDTLYAAMGRPVTDAERERRAQRGVTV